jgi:SPP1 family predicted phage head-tail adaptor
MGAGALRHRITIERVTETQDSFGGTVTTWPILATMWASVEPLSGREQLLAQQVQAEVTHRVRVRYVAGVTAKMRITFGDRHFEILSVINPEERNRELELMCKELV